MNFLTNFLALHWAMPVAAAAGFAVGAVWYRLWGGPWMRAIGKAPGELAQGLAPYITAVIANLLIAFVLGNVMRMFEISGPIFGVIFAFLFWLGFTIPVMALNNAFAGRPARLTLIDGGHAVVNICVQGAVLGWFNVARSGY